MFLRRLRMQPQGIRTLVSLLSGLLSYVSSRWSSWLGNRQLRLVGIRNIALLVETEAVRAKIVLVRSTYLYTPRLKMATECSRF
ncbi:hypothetical protein F5Y06DRAFT_267606 [Hypoxylon sp. FL0890]|nr:hypothetical protein F5Y06DRAFT_267606 [Hypoxylon sp. FL0890]